MFPFKGYEPKLAPHRVLVLSGLAMDRARSLPPGGGMDQGAINPFCSQKVQQEALLRLKRPEDLPIPPDDDLELEAVQDGATWALGKGRGASVVGGRIGACM